MSTYDDYFTNDDKPFAENLNDALLLSNVFDLTVPIELPRMFTNSAWVNSVSPRKAGVSIVTLDEQLSGISIGTDSDDNSILTATEDTAFGFYFYPNFNSFGQIHSISWEGTDDITVDLYTDNNVLITENINNGSLQESSVHLRQLKPLLVVVNMPDESVLNSFTIVMQNKQQDRYGAEVGISDVNGLNDRFANLETTMTENYNALDNAKVDKVAGKQLSTNDFDDTYKDYVDAYTGYNEEHINYWDNMEYSDGLSNNPLVIEQVGRVFHLHGTWKTSSSISIRSQASKVLGLFSSSPAPNYPIYSSQLITNGGSYEIMVSPDRKIELTNVAKSSDLTIPANTVCYVNVMWILDW
ncbi:MAG: hypothetical protein Q4Q19_03515 [Methanobrevibacter sp.]|nr:hypothetical protein [Methanobrevibacter sp.]